MHGSDAGDEKADVSLCPMAAFDRPPLTLGQVRRYVGNGSRRLIELSLGEGAPEAEI